MHDEHPLVVHQLNNVASALQAQGEVGRARALYHEMVARYEEMLRADHPLHAIALNNLSATFYMQGALDSAEHYLRQAVEMHVRMSEDGLDADIALGYHNLGSLQRAQGRLAEAERSLAASYRQRIELYGEENPATLRTGAAYADVIAQRGRIAEAETMLRRILELQQPDNVVETTPDASRTMGYLAGALVQRGAYDEAEHLYRAALAVAEQQMPSGHPRRRELESGLAEVLRRTGQATP
jgi:tetratricopeptide (TPR) repeat protein